MVSEHQMYFNGVGNKESSLEQHDSDKRHHPQYYRNLVEVQESDLGSRASPSSEDRSCNYCPTSLLTWYTAVDNGCHSCNISPVPHRSRNFLSLF